MTDDRGVPASGDISARKGDHLRVALEQDVGHATLTTGLERLRLRARALPPVDLGDVDLGCRFLDRTLRAPLLISCMTGGVGTAGPVNRALAVAAQAHGVALGLGSGRALLAGADPSSYLVRDVAPDVVLLANIGAVNLPDLGTAGCERLLETTGADGLVVHLNAVQEAVQPEGDTAFGEVLGHIAAVCEELAVPVIAKEVGFGLAPEDVTVLAEAGVSGVDVAGAGGTNWATVEGFRDQRARRVAAAFADWGWTTTEAVRGARAALDRQDREVVLIGSGGLRDGVDAAKVCCLGADLAGFGRELLAAGAEGPDAAVAAVGVLVDQLRIAVWASGGRALGDLGPELLLTS